MICIGRITETVANVMVNFILPGYKCLKPVKGPEDEVLVRYSVSAFYLTTSGIPCDLLDVRMRIAVFVVARPISCYEWVDVRAVEHPD